MKKFAAILLALVLLAGLTVSAFAIDSTGKITVTGIEAGADVKAYKFINVDFTGGTVRGYTWDAAVATWMKKQTAAAWSSYTVKEMAEDTTTAYANFCSALSSAISSGEVSLTAISMTTTTADPDNNDYSATVGMGQYLIIVTGVSEYIYQPCTINLIPEEENGAWVLKPASKAHVKRTSIDIIKKITDSNGTNPRDEDTVGAGDTVYFEITIDVPVNPAYTTKSLTYTDYMSNGLTYTAGTYAAYGKTGGTVNSTAFDSTDITWSASTARSGYSQTERSWAYSDIKGFDQIVVKYSATLNSGAAVGTAVPNTAKVTWDEFHKEDTVKVYTYGLEILKRDGDTTSALAGAWFVVQENTGTAATPVWVDIGAGHGSTGVIDTSSETKIAAAYNNFNYWVSDTDGMINVTGLDEGSYRFIEVKAPADYNLLTEPVAFTITAEKDTAGLLTGKIADDPAADTIGCYDSTVDDYAKITLPETGGIGTALFTAIGSVTMLAAGLILFINRKKIFGK